MRALTILHSSSTLVFKDPLECSTSKDCLDEQHLNDVTIRIVEENKLMKEKRSSLLGNILRIRK